ncbi:MAG: hypothetical protein QW112_03770, partial [Candidatus Micrarchaeia archaeon]
TTFTITATGERKKFPAYKGGKAKVVQGMIELGTGDLAIPAALTVSSYKLGGLIFPAGAFVGAVLGLYLVLDIVERERKIMPAMPSIGLFSLLFLFAVIFISYFLGV